MTTTESPLCVCSRCGSRKRVPLMACAECRWEPITVAERILAVALSDNCLSATQLSAFATDIKAKTKFVIPRSAMERAAHLVRMLDKRTRSVKVDDSRSVKPAEVSEHSTAMRRDAPTATKLERNSFAVLGASIRDNRQRLFELAEERALHTSEEACNAARAELTNPRNRLSAEIAWFPGVAPARVHALLADLRKNPRAVREVRGLPPLGLANLMAAALELVDSQMEANEWSLWILEMAEAEDAIDADAVLREINEERAIAGFPSVTGGVAVEAVLSERRRYFKETMIEALDRVPSSILVEAMTRSVSKATGGGHDHAPLLIEDIAAAYELQATAALQKGAAGIAALVEDASTNLSHGEQLLKPYIDQIDSLVRKWDAVAQPVQLIMKTRGLDHEPSVAVAHSIRSLAIDAVNEHDLIAQGKRLTELLADVFAELPEMVERLDQDAEALKNLTSQKEQSERDRREWEQSITYAAELGTVFKDKLSISPAGVEWKDQKFALESVNRVRWGAVRSSVNGIPTGTTYTVAFGDSANEAVCETRQETAWGEFVQRLWKAVGFRITLEMLAKLKSGKKLTVGDAIVDDMGVTLPRHAFFGGSDPVYCRWHELRVWSAEGNFYIASQADKKVYAELAYITTHNLHLFELALRKFFETPKARFSQVFED